MSYFNLVCSETWLISLFKYISRFPFVVQWLRICLAIQETPVPSLAQSRTQLKRLSSMHNEQHLAFPIYQYTAEISILQIKLILRNNHIIFHDLKILMHSSPITCLLKGFHFHSSSIFVVFYSAFATANNVQKTF